MSTDSSHTATPPQPMTARNALESSAGSREGSVVQAPATATAASVMQPPLRRFGHWLGDCLPPAAEWRARTGRFVHGALRGASHRPMIRSCAASHNRGARRARERRGRRDAPAARARRVRRRTAARRAASASAAGVCAPLTANRPSELEGGDGADAELGRPALVQPHRRRGEVVVEGGHHPLRGHAGRLGEPLEHLARRRRPPRAPSTRRAGRGRGAAAASAARARRPRPRPPRARRRAGDGPGTCWGAARAARRSSSGRPSAAAASRRCAPPRRRAPRGRTCPPGTRRSRCPPAARSGPARRRRSARSAARPLRRAPRVR